MAVNDDFSSNDPRVHIFSTADEVFVATASAITRIIVESKKSPHFNVIVAGGKSVVCTLQNLVSSDAPWQRVNWYLADERCVPDKDTRRNDLQIIDTLKKSLGKNYGHVCSSNPHLTPKDAAIEYASRIHRVDMFDFCLLGMGDDGHIASLTTNHPVLNSNQVCSEIIDSPNPPAERITLTLKTLSQISNRIIVTTGANKSQAVREFISNPRSPVRLLNPTAIFADRVAYS